MSGFPNTLPASQAPRCQSVQFSDTIKELPNQGEYEEYCLNNPIPKSADRVIKNKLNNWQRREKYFKNTQPAMCMPHGFIFNGNSYPTTCGIESDIAKIKGVEDVRLVGLSEQNRRSRYKKSLATAFIQLTKDGNKKHVFEKVCNLSGKIKINMNIEFLEQLPKKFGDVDIDQEALFRIAEHNDQLPELSLLERAIYVFNPEPLEIVDSFTRLRS